MTTRREQTHQRLQRAAIGLFSAYGYDGTSVAQIAAEANVTEMTFFRHFPSKDSLLVDDPYDPAIAAAIGAQPEFGGPLTRAARGIRSAWSALPPGAEEDMRVRLRIVAQTPSLRASLVRTSAATENVIADVLTDGMTARIHAVIAAGAVMGALNAALLEWAVTEDQSLGVAVRAALEVLEGDRG